MSVTHSQVLKSLCFAGEGLEVHHKMEESQLPTAIGQHLPTSLLPVWKRQATTSNSDLIGKL